MKCNYFEVLLLLFCLLLTINCGLKIKNMKIVDELDREVLINGGCVVVRNKPYFPITDKFDAVFSFSQRDIEVYNQLGMNGVRLGAMWPGIEPKKDWYNETFLQQMVKFVNRLGENGIYTMLDFHQDILSQKFCGDGMPVWLIDQVKGYKTFPFPTGKKIPLNSSGLPKDCDSVNWAKYYASDDVGQIFNHLYNTNHYIHHKFVAYWRKIASYFKGNPYIIAYELINEPFVGNAVRNPFLLIPSVAQRVKFQQFYDSVVEGIRQIDNDTNICFEPITFDFAFNSGFTHAPGGNKYRNKSILCYHYESPPVRSLKTMEARLRDMKRLGVPVLMSQYCGSPVVRQFVQDHLQSYFWWEYKSYIQMKGRSSNVTFTKSKEKGGLGLVNPDGTINDPEVKVAARTSMHKTAGNLKRMTYRQQTGHFNALYEATPGGTSIMFFSKNRLYKNGYALDVTPKDLVKVRQDGNYVQITYVGAEPTLVLVNLEKL